MQNTYIRLTPSIWMTEQSITDGLKALRYVKEVQSVKLIPDAHYPMGKLYVHLRVSAWSHTFRYRRIEDSIKVAVSCHFPVGLY